MSASGLQVAVVKRLAQARVFHHQVEEGWLLATGQSSWILHLRLPDTKAPDERAANKRGDVPPSCCASRSARPRGNFTNLYAQSVDAGFCEKGGVIGPVAEPVWSAPWASSVRSI